IDSAASRDFGSKFWCPRLGQPSKMQTQPGSKGASCGSFWKSVWCRYLHDSLYTACTANRFTMFAILHRRVSWGVPVAKVFRMPNPKDRRSPADVKSRPQPAKIAPLLGTACPDEESHATIYLWLELADAALAD